MDGDFFRAVVASIGHGVIVVDELGLVVYANGAADAALACRLQGLSLDALPSPIRDPRTGGAFARDNLDPVRVARGLPPEGADWVVGPRGRLLGVTCSPLRASATPGHSASVSLLLDVTERRREEQKMDRSRRFLDSIVENIPDMVFVKDAKDLRFELFNRAGEELLGLAREQMLGRTDHDFFPEEQAAFFQSRDRQTLTEGRLVDVPEEPIDTAHGRRWLHTKKIPVHDDAGRPLYLLGISSDITARRAAEEALKTAHEELERRVEERTEALRSAEEQLRHAQKLEAVGRLAGGVAHDFNNVLAVILGYVGLMDQRAPEGLQRESLQAIRAAAEHATALTRQLLAFSRRHTAELRVMNVNRIVEKARAMLERLLGEQIAIQAALSPSLSNVKADPALIEQVFVNLAVNARDAMPTGGTLSVKTENVSLAATDRPPHGLAPGRYVELSVTDTGIGMDDATQARIFEPFFTTKDAGKGTGLGLAMAYGVVAQCGGGILVESVPGQGTTFRVLIPVALGTRSQTPPPGPVASLSGGNETILVAEDEASLRRIVRSVLEQAGYVVLDAENGEAALQVGLAHPGPIHLLLSDVVMPVRDGPSLARALREKRPTLRVLFMSGYADERVGDAARKQSEAPPLAKPFSVETLTARVREVLDAQALRKGSTPVE